MEPILTRYANRTINSKYYGVVKITGEAEETKTLTREEFRNGKPGFVFMDNKTGKLIFDK